MVFNGEPGGNAKVKITRWYVLTNAKEFHATYFSRGKEKKAETAVQSYRYRLGNYLQLRGCFLPGVARKSS